jgi:hypothetical protein
MLPFWSQLIKVAILIVCETDLPRPTLFEWDGPEDATRRAREFASPESSLRDLRSSYISSEGERENDGFD